MDRTPTKLERGATIALSLCAVVASGAVMVTIWMDRPRSVPALAFFSILFLAGAAVFVRATFTRSRKLSASESAFLSRCLVGFGSVGAVAATLYAAEGQRLMLLGASLLCVFHGLSGLLRRNR